MCAARERGVVLRVENTDAGARAKSSFLLNTCMYKGVELFRRTVNVLFGKTNSKYDSTFCFAVTMPR